MNNFGLFTVIVIATVGLLSIIIRIRRIRSSYRLIDLWAKASLENKFWRMLAGKEPIANDDLGRFVGDLQMYAKSVLEKRSTKDDPIALSPRWFMQKTGQLSELLACSHAQRHYADETLPERIPDWLELVITEGALTPPDELDKFNLRTPNGEYEDYGRSLTFEFVRKLVTFYAKGLSAVLKQIPIFPDEAIRSLSTLWLPESYNRLKSLCPGEIDTSLELARQALDALRAYENDPGVNRLIKRYESIIKEVEAQKVETSMADVVAEANLLLQHLEQREAVRLAMVRFGSLVDTHQATEELNVSTKSGG